jgi:MFS family permease
MGIYYRGNSFDNNKRSHLVSHACFDNRLYLPPFPESCTFLNSADRVLAVARGREGFDKEESSMITKPSDRAGSIVYRFNFLQFFDIIQDIRIWLLALAYLTIAAALDFLLVATPEVTSLAFGFSNVCEGNCTVENIDFSHGISFSLQILSMAPYGAALVFSYLLAVKSDDTGDRATYILYSLLTAIIGFFILAVVPSNQSFAYFFGILPAVVGLLSSVPSVLSYSMDHASGDTQRATVGGIAVGLGQSFGLLLTALQQLEHNSGFISSTGVYWINFLLLLFGFACVVGVSQLNVSEEQSVWGKAPGLRRLLNDADEAKAWDEELELSNVDDFIKTGTLGDALEND